MAEVLSYVTLSDLVLLQTANLLLIIVRQWNEAAA